MSKLGSLLDFSGKTALVTGGLFGVALFLSPLFLAVPSFATAPALIVVGFMMVGSLLKVDFTDLADAIPAFLCFLAIPFLYSISEGIALGVISYVVIHAAAGRKDRRRISPAMYVLAALFVLKYILI